MAETRPVSTIVFLLFACLSAQAQITPPERLGVFTRDTFGPTSMLRAGAGAGLSQWTNGPPEWEQGGAGFARRFFSRVGENTVQNGIEMGAGLALHEDPRYHRKGNGPVGQRVWYALTSVLIYHREDGTSRPALAKVGAIYSANMISMSWHPDRFRATSDGVRAGNIRVGSTAAVNVLREFWPEIRRLIRH